MEIKCKQLFGIAQNINLTVIIVFILDSLILSGSLKTIMLLSKRIIIYRLSFTVIEHRHKKFLVK